MEKLFKRFHRSLNIELGNSLYKTGMLFRRDGIRAGKGINITPEQLSVIMIVKHKGPVTQKEILERTMQDAPTLSRSLKRMEKHGLVRVKRDKKDKRVTRVHITPKASVTLASMGVKMKMQFNRSLSKFPDKKKKQLIKLLKELRDSFNKNANGKNGGKQ